MSAVGRLRQSRADFSCRSQQCSRRGKLQKKVLDRNRFFNAQSNRKAETYLYGCLGNNAFLKGDYDKSEKVYKELIKRLLEDGNQNVSSGELQLIGIFFQEAMKKARQ